jgi:predicted transcriptional regulator
MPDIPFHNLDHKEKEVVRVLNAARKPLNTNQIAERSDMSWKTAEKRLKQLHQKNWVIYRTKNQSKYWRLR